MGIANLRTTELAMSDANRSIDTKLEGRQDVTGIETVVDVDSQIQEDIDEIAEYIPKNNPSRDVVKMAKSARTFVYSGMSTYNLYDYKRADEGETPRLVDRDVEETIRPGGVTGLRRDLGIDVSVVNPTVNLGMAEMNNQRFATALARAYNSWLIDALEDYDGLVGNMIVAPHDPEQAAEEIDRVATEDSIVGLELPATGLTPPPGYRQYHPIYEAAADHGLPVSMHGVVGMKSFHQQFYSSESFAEDYVNHPAFVQMRNIDSIMFEGIPEFFPDLDFVINGMGLGFAPYTISRMDDHYLELGYEIPALEKMPSKYFRESFCWSTRPLGALAGSPDYIAKNVDMIGPENVVFGSDIPHPVSDRPEDVLAELDGHFDRDVLDGIMGGNAADVYGL